MGKHKATLSATYRAEPYWLKATKDAEDAVHEATEAQQDDEWVESTPGADIDSVLVPETPLDTEPTTAPTLRNLPALYCMYTMYI